MRLIDADALGIGPCNPEVFTIANKAYVLGWNNVVKIISNAPTIDPKELIPNGRWEQSEYRGFLKCSECKDAYIQEEWIKGGKKWNFCPNCGAKVGGSGV